jgi:hypothetical protein
LRSCKPAYTITLCLLLRPFTSICQQGFVVGAGLSGCATSALSLLAQLQASSTGEGGQRTAADVAPAAFLYFGAAAAITGLCIVCFSMLTRLKYSRAKLGPYLASEFWQTFHH